MFERSEPGCLPQKRRVKTPRHPVAHLRSNLFIARLPVFICGHFSFARASLLGGGGGGGGLEYLDLFALFARDHCFRLSVLCWENGQIPDLLRSNLRRRSFVRNQTGVWRSPPRETTPHTKEYRFSLEAATEASFQEDNSNEVNREV
jgi:hypothetical protein